ncbi:uncharacterized protein LOC121372168 isoform X2 [Gigantopelta aegis]|uniref:uncharacterized protein LOC121372168 isoform X2 n=1 Tax=Gigantopelta aegis TaxID=1735272 RepID=UPI001B88C0A6|nr:uncharacterized protein LOC121372168 isoform X2 [Gigantopelta aegis]
MMDSSGGYLHARVGDYSLNPDPSKQNEVNNLSKQRLDSGVGDMDIGMRPVSTNHRNTTYDYIDNHYEDVPSPTRINRSVSEQSTRKSTLSGMSGSSEVSDFDETSTAGIIKLADKRKKYNPLYQTSGHTAQKPSSEKSASVRNLQKRITCHSVVLIVVLTSSFGALGLSLYLMMESESRHVETAKTLKMLQDKYENVSTQLSNTTSVLADLKEQLSDAQKKIAFTQVDLTERLNQVNSNMSQHIQNLTSIIVSKDLSEFTKLSSCYYKNYTTAMTRGTGSYPTQWHPMSPEPEAADVPMFAFCSVKGGVTEILETKYISANKLSYRCSCGGVTNDPERLCTLHLWLCPQGS